MILIIDTSIVFAALAKDSTTRNLLIDSPFTLLAPETMIKEIRKYESLILKKSGLSKEEFETLFELLIENIRIVEKEEYLQEILNILENRTKSRHGQQKI